MKKTIILLLLHCVAFAVSSAQPGVISPIPSVEPGKYQLEQIKRKYGMFIHFSINTFHDVEWSDGSLPASTYNPTAVDAEQWAKTAKDAGMRYIILVTKHHDGFCLWNSKFTDYTVANSGNKTDVIEALAKACNKYHIGLGLYYSLWDRRQNANTDNTMLDGAYNKFMLGQLVELIDIAKKCNTKIVEFWFDGGWVKPNTRWPVAEIYETIKSREPQCQVGINWSIGSPENADQHLILPGQQKDGYPIRYFPSDFRLGDPYLPANPDPKLFINNNQKYYMPWESTMCISKRWFYNTTDTVYKPIDVLAKDYKIATAQNNILILDTPPDRGGRIRQKDIDVLMELKKAIQN